MRRLFGAVFALLVMSVGAQAQDTFPNKPIQMVVPFPDRKSTCLNSSHRT